MFFLAAFLADAVVRLQHCTPLFVVTTLAQSQLAQQCFAPEELATASALATAAHSGQTQVLQALVNRSPVLRKYPAWSAKQRPASAMKQLELLWELPLKTLKTAVARLLEHSTVESLSGPEKTWKGDQFQLMLQLTCDERPCLELSCFISLEGTIDAVRHVTWSSDFFTTSGGVSAGSGFVRTQSFRGQERWIFGGQSNMLGLGRFTSWAAAEAKLREQQLVHSDGCLHLRARVTKLI